MVRQSDGFTIDQPVCKKVDVWDRDMKIGTREVGGELMENG